MSWHHWCPLLYHHFCKDRLIAKSCHAAVEHNSSAGFCCKLKGHSGYRPWGFSKIQIPPPTMSFALSSLLGHVTYLARSSKPGKSWGDAASALNTYRTPHHRHPLSGSAGCIPGGFSSPALLEGPGTTCPLQQK